MPVYPSQSIIAPGGVFPVAIRPDYEGRDQGDVEHYPDRKEADRWSVLPGLRNGGLLDLDSRILAHND